MSEGKKLSVRFALSFFSAVGLPACLPVAGATLALGMPERHESASTGRSLHLEECRQDPARGAAQALALCDLKACA